MYMQGREKELPGGLKLKNERGGAGTMTTMHSIERAKERAGISARAAEHLMKNYLDFGKCGGGRWKRYLYLDTEDFLLGSLLTREQVKVKFETCLMRDNEKYRMVMMKVVCAALEGPGEASLEERMGCGAGFCYGCSIQTKNGPRRVCKDGPVFKKEDLIW